jgi:light-regulated signal transduction histidine kinase (bacteriophytochrome)
LAELDLTACDREPIHIPGAVQPHGVLLALDAKDLRIQQAGGACERLLGLAPPALLGRAFGQVVEGAGSRLTVEAVSDEPMHLGSVYGAGRLELDAVAHAYDSQIIVELEPAPRKRRSSAELARILETVSRRFAATRTLAQLCQTAAIEFRKATGFDRVMVYQFLADETGSVVAEDKVEDLPPFLNHRYPASDIPQQARALYLRNIIRVIPDAGYAPAELVVEDDARPPLDMTNAHLRSVSPIHLQYLHNMGVVASASVSIIREGRLWGLVSCHHRSPKALNFDDRMLCRLLASSLSQQVASLEEGDLYRARLRSRAAEDELLSLFARGTSVEDELASHTADLLRPLPATGVAVRRGERLWRAGRCPDEAHLVALAEWLLSRAPGGRFATSSLQREYAAAAVYPDAAAGLLAVTIPSGEPYQLLWFRAEQVEVIEWAGNPHKAAEAEGPAGLLTPRKSFEVWRETVRGRSEPWAPTEIEAAERIARGLGELERNQNIGRLNESLTRALSERDSLLTHKDYLLREGDHRIQNSLQILASMLTMQLREVTDPVVRTQLEEALSRVHAVSAVHRRLFRTEQPQSVDIDSYVKELLADLGPSLGSAWSRELRVHSAPLTVPTEIAMSLGLVVTELVLNAAKYAYDGRPGPVDIDLEGGPDRLQVRVRDYGRGSPDERPQGGGFGSKLMSGLVRRLQGDIRRAAAAPGSSVTIQVPLQARSGVKDSSD